MYELTVDGHRIGLLLSEELSDIGQRIFIMHWCKSRGVSERGVELATCRVLQDNVSVPIG